MNRALKLIWDFRGADGWGTAKHHCLHLRDFASREQLHFYEIDVEKVSDVHASAYVVVDEADLKTYRDALRPHRGKWTPLTEDQKTNKQNR